MDIEKETSMKFPFYASFYFIGKFTILLYIHRGALQIYNTIITFCIITFTAILLLIKVTGTRSPSTVVVKFKQIFISPKFWVPIEPQIVFIRHELHCTGDLGGSSENRLSDSIGFYEKNGKRVANDKKATENARRWKKGARRKCVRSTNWLSAHRLLPSKKNHGVLRRPARSLKRLSRKAAITLPRSRDTKWFNKY